MADSKVTKSPFDLPGVVQLEAGQNSLPRFRITTADAEAHVYLHGAHVTHFQPKSAKAPVLFMSGKSTFEEGKPIRGGVPIIFPWFGPHPKLTGVPAHGFARTNPWKPVESKQLKDGRASLTLSLTDTPATRALWPQEFELRFTVIVGKSLEMALEVRNLSPGRFSFEEALHSYFTVGDIKKVQLSGLSGRVYLDKMENAARKTQEGPIRFAGETDRVYIETPDDVKIDDSALNRKITVGKENSLATVVWNPWIEKAKRMPDFGDEEWPGMVCVETANVAEHAIKLEAGERHVMRATISV